MLKLPRRVGLVEVGPRDGLQSHPRRVPTETKARLVALLADAGLCDIELTAFGRADKLPMLDDAEALCRLVAPRPGLRLRGLAPNARGARRAVDAGVQHVVALACASAAYAERNQNMGPLQTVRQALEAHAIARAAGRGFSVGISMALWCPFEGPVAPAAVESLVDALQAAGVDAICLAGSLGMEDPRQVHALFQRLAGRWPALRLGYHVHDVAGFGAANILAALEGGACWLEGAICGLGGGVSTPTASGNFPTEDMVHLLQRCGVQCDSTPERAAQAAREAAHLLGIPGRGRLARVPEALGRDRRDGTHTEHTTVHRADNTGDMPCNDAPCSASA